jgi:hypothetical protein
MSRFGFSASMPKDLSSFLTFCSVDRPVMLWFLIMSLYSNAGISGWGESGGGLIICGQILCRYRLCGYNEFIEVNFTQYSYQEDDYEGNTYRGNRDNRKGDYQGAGQPP